MHTAPDGTTSEIIRLPKAEAIEKIAKHLTQVRAQLDTAKAQLKAAVSPDKYVLNFRVNALRKQVNTGKAHIARFKKAPGTDVIWSDSFAS